MTQFGRALLALNIDIICADSPQAKGRIERAFGTLQDRMVKELRLAGVALRPYSPSMGGVRPPQSVGLRHALVTPNEAGADLQEDRQPEGGTATTTVDANQRLGLFVCHARI